MTTKYEKTIPIGKLYGQWTVTGIPYTDKKGRAKVPVQCECGDLYDIHVHNLESGKSTQCKNCSTGQSSTYASMSNRFKLSATPQQIDYSLNADSISHSFAIQSETCAVTGQELTTTDAQAIMWNSEMGLTPQNTFFVNADVKKQLRGMDLKTFNTLSAQWQSRSSTINQDTEDPVTEFFNRRENNE